MNEDLSYSCIDNNICCLKLHHSFYLLHGHMCFISARGNTKHFTVEATHICRGKLCSDRHTQRSVQTSDTILKEYTRTIVAIYTWKIEEVLSQHQNILPAPCFHHWGLMNYTSNYYGYSRLPMHTSWIRLPGNKSDSVWRQRGVKCDAMIMWHIHMITH